MTQIISLFVSLFILISCSSERPQGKTAAEVLYKEAQVNVENKRYILANEKLNMLKNRYPYSYYATPAELMQAEILFKQEKFAEAAAAFIVFRDFHPKHPKSSYVLLMIAESFFNQVPDTFDRDLQPAEDAIKYYREMLATYPNSPHRPKALENMLKCKEMLRSKEKYIADFYYKTEVYDAARWRYLEILNEFQNPSLKNHSMKRIILSSYHMGEKQDCLRYYQKYAPFIGKDEKVEDTLEECRK